MNFVLSKCRQIWLVVLHYQFHGINSVVNAFIYGIRHMKYGKAYLHILSNHFLVMKLSTKEFIAAGLPL